MAQAVKRRSTAKGEHTRRASLSTPNVKRRWWVNEVLAVACAVITVLLFLSFITFHLNLSIEHPTGPVGRVVGALLSGFFGWGTLAPISFLAWLSVTLWKRDDSAPLWSCKAPLALGSGLLGLVVFPCALFSLWLGKIFHQSDGSASPGMGGSLGDLIGHPLLKLFGLTGTTLILLAATFCCISLASGKGLGELALILGKAGGWGARLSTLVVPKYLWHGTLTAIGFIVRPIRSALMEEDYGDNEENERIIPPPRRRKNILPATEEGRGDGEDGDDMKSSFADLPPAVVERRENGVRVAERELREVRKRVIERTKEVEEFANYVLPEVSLLTRGESSPGKEDDKELHEKSKQIEGKLRDFGIFGKVTHIHPGPVITLYEFEPAPGVKVGKIASLQDDLAMSLKATAIRIVAPIPRRGTVGIEVPNRHRDVVRLRDLLESKELVQSESILAVPIGKDTYGDPVIADIATMPHILIAGTTGTGKSVCINAVLMSLLYRASPADLGLILIDPKVLELSVYDDIPHLRVPVVTVPRQAKAVLEWAVNEMNRRYRMMQRYGVRNIDSYNRVVRGEKDPQDIVDDKSMLGDKLPVVELTEEQVIEEGTVVARGLSPEELGSVASEKLRPLSKIVIVIDELADLMLTVGRDIEELITRLAQKARAAGIHLIVATQRPSVDVVTGLIKANFPARMSFRVATRIDSRTILDSMGAERLLGKGDMLFMIPGSDGIRRVHGAFISDSEVKKVIDSIKKQCKPAYDERIMAMCDKALEEDKPEGEGGSAAADDYDDMYDKCVELVVSKGQASTSMLQRVFRLGYNRAARIIDMMEREGVVGPMDGAKPRSVLAPRSAAGNEEG